MPFDWGNYYALAESLRTSPEESCLRSAISRVYYSVYCQARNLLIEEWDLVIRDTESAHSKVWRFYREKGGTFAAIGRTGTKLFANRVNADYDDEIERLDELVIESFRYADNVLTYLEQIQQ
jgi:uncharacterized protein (UPF0332 family)